MIKKDCDMKCGKKVVLGKRFCSEVCRHIDRSRYTGETYKDYIKRKKPPKIKETGARKK